jgi:hypothetical protein
MAATSITSTPDPPPVPGQPQESRARCWAVAHWHHRRWYVSLQDEDDVEVGVVTAASLADVADAALAHPALADRPVDVVVEADVPESVWALVNLSNEIRAGLLRPFSIVHTQVLEASLVLSELGLDDEDVARIVGDEDTAPTIGCTSTC